MTPQRSYWRNAHQCIFFYNRLVRIFYNFIGSIRFVNCEYWLHATQVIWDSTLTLMWSCNHLYCWLILCPMDNHFAYWSVCGFDYFDIWGFMNKSAGNICIQFFPQVNVLLPELLQCRWMFYMVRYAELWPPNGYFLCCLPTHSNENSSFSPKPASASHG